MPLVHELVRVATRAVSLSISMETSDSDPVTAVQRGDRDAFTELFRRHYSAVLASCTKRLGNPAGTVVAEQLRYLGRSVVYIKGRG